MTRLNLQISLLALAFASSCLTAQEQPLSKLAEGCVLNSDCASPLVCVFRLCHQPCTEARDCPAPSNCQLAGDPAQLVCTQLDCTVAPCPIGQVCGDDQQCRFGCLSAAGCALGQVCVENQCEWPERTTTDGGLPPSTSVNTCRTNSECGADGGVCRFGACGPECLQNRDCAVSNGETCAGGRCVTVGEEDAGPATECRYNSNCIAPKICAQFGSNAGTCVDECKETRDCVVSNGGGYVCTKNTSDAGGFCERNFGTSDAGCFYSSQCGVAERCDRGACIPECQMDRDCSFGQQCVSNRCVSQGTDGGTCSYNSQCGANQRCSPQGVCIVECLANRDCLQAAGQCCSDFACVTGAACFTSADAGTLDGGATLPDGGFGFVPLGGPCSVNIQCIDNDFCNGTESCSNNICVTGTNPCDDRNPCTIDQCTASSRTCAYQSIAVDADHDNHYPRSCGGTADDCDDTNATVYPGAIELCDWKDNDCDGDTDENLWHEEPGARGAISGAGSFSNLVGAPAAQRIGNDVIVIAAGLYSSGAYQAYRLNASTMTVVSGPTSLGSPTTAWQQCSNNGATDSRQLGFVDLAVSDAGMVFTGLTFNFEKPAAQCCFGDTLRTDSPYALITDFTLATVNKGTLVTRSNTYGCGQPITSPQYSSLRTASLAFEAQRDRWVSTFWAVSAIDSQTMELRRRTLARDGGLGADELVYAPNTNPASKYPYSLYSADGNAKVAVGANSVLFAWTNERIQPYAARFVRWVVYDLDVQNVVAGPFDTTLADVNGNLATFTPDMNPRIDGLVFDGSNYVMTLSSPIQVSNPNGIERVQTLFIAENGVLAPQRRWWMGMGPPSGSGYQGGMHAASTIAGNGLAVAVQSGQLTRVAIAPRDNPDAGFAVVNLQITPVPPAGALERSDLAMVPLDEFRLGLFWTDDRLNKTVVKCGP